MKYTATISALALSTCLAWAPVQAMQVSQPKTYNIQIGEQRLDRALNVLAQKLGLQLLIQSDDVRGVQASLKAGTYTHREALEALLLGTNLTFSQIDESTIAIVPLGVSGAQNISYATGYNYMSGIAVSSDDESIDEVKNHQFEEITVTAQKRSALLQDVPVAVSAMTGSQLQKLGASDFKDVLRRIPGVSFSGVELGQSKYNIRGVSTTSTSPTVGVYLDDISLLTIATNFNGATDPIFFDFERLEVLKGPQGTLYGGNAMGGAIKYVSRKPNMNETEVSTSAGLSTTKGGDVSYEGQAVLNYNVVEDKLAIRTGFLYRELGGYIDQVPDGEIVDWRYSTGTSADDFTPSTKTSLGTKSEKNHNDATMYVARFSALWTPDDSLTILPSLFIQRYELDNTSSFYPNLPGLQTSKRYEEPSEDKLDVFSLSITKNFGDLELTSLTGYVDRSVGWDRDYSFFIGSLVSPLYSSDSYNVSNSSTKNLTQELRLDSGYTDSAWHWTIGLFYSHQKDNLYQAVDTSGAGTFFGTGTDIVYVGDTDTKTDEYAAFGEVTYSITPDFDAVVGLRAFGVEQTVDALYDGVLNGGQTMVENQKRTESGLNPKFSLVYRVTEDSMAYATASKGFRQGGPNRFQFDPDLCRADLDRLGIDDAPEGFDSDSIWSYELGSKNRLADGKVTLNGSVFLTEWSQIQQTVELTGCGFNFTGNVGSAEIKGLELEAQLRPLDSLLLTGSLTYTDAKITESNVGVSAQSGQNVLDVPEWMFNLSSTYTASISSEWTMTIQADYQYHGSNYRSFDALHTTSLNGTAIQVANIAQVQDSYDVANAYVLFSNDLWDYRLYVKNIFNSTPYLDYGLNDALNATTLRPRTIGIDISTRF
ncbi:TonB-dependent receptor domain-containing protein [Kordiimonas pumila]|uniref:TonB-dependent receptor domain-containing protein n=1 Tax=Kordiimonas pumila TaxID=2161677 RepID=A0ABV7D1R0_9PROT|nr:TonB-dependent receptor [Kordiimonas pumila]